MIATALAMLAMIAPARSPDSTDARPASADASAPEAGPAESSDPEPTSEPADAAEGDPVADDASAPTPAPNDGDAPDYRWGDGTEPTNAAAPPTDGPLGGYLGPTETKELEPADGERKLLVAYILLPLGTLATVTGAVSWWLTSPAQCQHRFDSLSASDCRGLMILNIVRTSYGSLMIASGAVLLGIGLHERKKHREWTRRHGAYVQPILGPRAAGLVFGGRF